VAGLGNPGPSYERSRHNVGFRVADEVARRLGVDHWKKRDEALQAHVARNGVVLVKPLSYMNDSGRPVAKIASWWKTPPAEVLIVSDDLDLPFGRLRMRAGGGSGGHNGLKSIIEYLGDGFPRLRVGVGRDRTDAIDYVLSPFGADEERELPQLIDTAASGVVRWLERGPTDAIQFVNAWRPSAPERSEDETPAS
jgi:peptidyl-tRNA hydrolase, PTH1 family